MATPFDRLMMTIIPRLPGAVEMAIKTELFFVCHEFFDKSNVWREEIEFELKDGEQTSYIIPVAGKINRLLGVLNKDKRVVYGAIMPEENTIRMPPSAAQNEFYTAIVALTVSDPVARDAYPIVPYDLIQRYQPDLIAGICAAMMLQPSKPYTNATLGAFNQVSFNSGAARAKNDALVGDAFGSQRWVYPQTFNFRR